MIAYRFVSAGFKKQSNMVTSADVLTKLLTEFRDEFRQFRDKLELSRSQASNLERTEVEHSACELQACQDMPPGNEETQPEEKTLTMIAPPETSQMQKFRQPIVHALSAKRLQKRSN